MNITYLFLMISVVCTIGTIASIMAQDYRVLIPMMFFAIMGMIAFIQIRKEENTPCKCENGFWESDGFCFRCGGHDPKNSITKAGVFEGRL